jgi:hypothetical protein
MNNLSLNYSLRYIEFSNGNINYVTSLYNSVSTVTMYWLEDSN